MSRSNLAGEVSEHTVYNLVMGICIPYKTSLAVVLCLWGGMPPDMALGQAASLPADTAREESLLKAVGPTARIRRTPNFVIAYNTPEPIVDGLISRLTYTYGAIRRFCEANGIEMQQPGKRLEVLFFDQRSEYDRYSAGIGFASAGTHGVYAEINNRSAFFNMWNDPELVQLAGDIVAAQESLDKLVNQLDRIKGSRTRVRMTLGDGRVIEGTKEEVESAMNARIAAARRTLNVLDARRKRYSDRINETVIQHEAAHQILFNCGVHVRQATNPRWLVEGLACLFETPPTGRGSGIGTINQSRLRDFREAAGNGTGRKLLKADDFLAAVEAGRLVEPRQLLTDPDLFSLRGRDGSAVYALSWSLTHYLQRSHTARFAAYIKDLRSRTPGQQVTGADEIELFEKHFGPLDAAFLRRWGTFILQLTYRPPESEL